MADNTELKKLNKTVDEAVQMLKIYMGSASNLKVMNEKQRAAIEKWFDVGEQAEETIKQQRAFTERKRDSQGRFVKKMEFNFMGIANAISGIFIGMAKGVGNMIGGIAKGITSHLKGFFSAVKRHFLGLFGEESEWFDILGSIKDSVVGFFGWFAKGFLWVFKKTPSWASKMVNIMGDMYALQIKQMKMEFLTREKKPKATIWSILGGLLFIGAMLVGAWIRKKLIAIEMMLKGFKLDRIWLRFKNWIKGIPGRIRARFTWIDDIAKSRAFQWLKRGFIKLGGWMKSFGRWLLKAPILGKLLRGLKFGFKLLGWPLTILLGIIDFIKGWRATEGNWQDKLVGGLKEVFHGLLDLPLEILGWAIDKVMGWFGVESTGTGDKLKKWFDDFMGFIFEWGPIGIISDIIAGFTSEGGFSEAFAPKIEKIKSIMGSILDIFLDIWNGMVGWLQEKTKWLPSWLQPDWLEGLKADTTKPQSAPSNDLPKLVASHEAKKIEMQNDNAKQIKQAVDESTIANKQNSQRTGSAIAQMTNVVAGGGGGTIVEQKQIPDEVDNYPMLMKCHNGGSDE